MTADSYLRHGILQSTDPKMRIAYLILSTTSFKKTGKMTGTSGPVTGTGPDHFPNQSCHHRRLMMME